MLRNLAQQAKNRFGDLLPRRERPATKEKGKLRAALLRTKRDTTTSSHAAAGTKAFERLKKKSRAAKLFKTRAGTKTDLYEDEGEAVAKEPQNVRQLLARKPLMKRGFFPNRVSPRSEDETSHESGADLGPSHTKFEINDEQNRVLADHVTLPPAALFTKSDKLPFSARERTDVSEGKAA